MAGFFDLIRAKLNGIVEKLEDPVEMAKLDLSDLKKALKEAEACAAEVVGQPPVIREDISKLKTQIAKAEKTIQAMVDGGQPDSNILPFVQGFNDLEEKLATKEAELAEAEPLAQDMKSKIDFLRTEIASRERNLAASSAQLKSAKAEVKLNSSLGKVGDILGSGANSKLDDMVKKEKAKAAGYSAMNGLDLKVDITTAARKSTAEATLERFKKKPN